SPHYTTSLRSRHSLYGTEDRVVLDIGSSFIKAGFSGEPAPRECRRMTGTDADGELWGLEKSEPTEEEWLVREYRLRRVIRSIWFENLLIDPRTRKIIVVENPLLSTRIKEMIARVLFDNLQVPSLSFASAPVLALMAAGRLSGLVVDVGHLETTVTPVFHSRPLFPSLTTSPIAGRRLNRRLRALLLAFASYIAPPSSLTSTTPARVASLPREILTDDLVEQIKTRLCFVGGEALPADEAQAASALSSASGHSGGRGWIQVPGWVRERAAEVLWEDEGDHDARGLADVVLECLLRLPIDLRKPMATSILVTGGTAAMPGFFPRFKSALAARLEQSHPPSPPPLAPHLAVLNHPCPTTDASSSTLARKQEGSAPSYSPALQSWVGGSLAGALKTGGEEVTREMWD
ncbi:actin-like ATPase domain-containing protein, partial [Rhodotorula sp. JG-1b]